MGGANSSRFQLGLRRRVAYRSALNSTNGHLVSGPMLANMCTASLAIKGHLLCKEQARFATRILHLLKSPRKGIT